MTDRELFGAMCQEVFLKKCQAEIDAWDGGDECTPDHYRKLSEILGVRVEPPRPAIKRKVIVLFVAAALLLLTACAAIIYRDELRGLFVERMNDRDKVTANYLLDDQTNKVLEDVYYLSYVPDGFELQDDCLRLSDVYYKYCDSNGELIIFKQLSKKTSGYIDICYANKLKCNNVGFDVYYSQTKDFACYTWYNKDNYYFILSSREIDDKELERMIQNVIIKE